MVILLTIVHVVICVFLVIVVLLQSGKAADLAGAFGGMSQTTFGPRGSATVLSKATTIAAGLFMVTSLTLAIAASRNAGSASSVVERSKGTATTPAPVTNAPKPGAPPTVTVTPDSGSGKGTPVTIPVPAPAQQQQAPAKK